MAAGGRLRTGAVLIDVLQCRLGSGHLMPELVNLNLNLEPRDLAVATPG